MILTWDIKYADIDLHVLEPSGRHVYYRSKGGDYTPFLDYDDVDGFGPEHYFIDSNMDYEYGTY